MKNSSKYMLITGGIALGLAGGITIGVTEADDIRGVANAPKEFMQKVAGTGAQQPVIPMDDIVSHYNGKISFDQSVDLGGLRVQIELLVI